MVSSNSVSWPLPFLNVCKNRKSNDQMLFIDLCFLSIKWKETPSKRDGVSCTTLSVIGKTFCLLQTDSWKTSILTSCGFQDLNFRATQGDRSLQIHRKLFCVLHCEKQQNDLFSFRDPDRSAVLLVPPLNWNSWVVTVPTPVFIMTLCSFLEHRPWDTTHMHVNMKPTRAITFEVFCLVSLLYHIRPALFSSHIYIGN